MIANALRRRRKSYEKEGLVMKTGALLLAIFVLFTGCATQVEVYDASIAPDKLCTLEIVATIAVTKYDGEAVNWTASGLSSWKKIQIPAGRHEFVIDYTRYDMYSDEARAKDIKIGYDKFLAGHTYQLYIAQGDEIVFGRILYDRKLGSGKMVILNGNINSSNQNEIVTFLEDITD
jgi:hypothetical protein